MKKISEGELLETIIRAIEGNSPDGLCRNCPVVILLKDVAAQVSENNYQKIAKEFGIDFSSKKCPCSGKFTDRIE